jgi:AcrR family transcriptional regulator
LALDIIDRDGLAALNMRRLAAEAGVKPMSLYHHFPNKEAILDGVAECIAAAALGDAAEALEDAAGAPGHAAGALEVAADGRPAGGNGEARPGGAAPKARPGGAALEARRNGAALEARSGGPTAPAREAGGDWRERARLLFVGLYELVQAHPRALPLISTGVLRTPSGRRWMEELMGVLLGAGFTPDEAAELYHTVGGFTLGLGYAGLLSLEVPAAQIVAELAGHRQEYPNLLSVGLRLARWDRPDEFATGLDTLLGHYAERGRGGAAPAGRGRR